MQVTADRTSSKVLLYWPSLGYIYIYMYLEDISCNTIGWDLLIVIVVLLCLDCACTIKMFLNSRLQ